MAAGKGTRLKSQIPKVLHEVGGKPLLEHVIRAAVRIVPAKDVYAIIGHEADRVRAATEHTGVNFVLQAEQLGTGHALITARDALAGYDHVIVLSGDAPLITPETIGRLRNFHLQEQAAMTLLSADLEDPTGYGRVLRKTARGAEVQAIVEEKAASAVQKKIREMNSGFYVFAVKELYDNIGKLSTDNAHAEYYLTDMAELLRKARQRVVAFKTGEASEVLGANTRAELADIDEKMRLAKCRQLMADGDAAGKQDARDIQWRRCAHRREPGKGACSMLQDRSPGATWTGTPRLYSLLDVSAAPRTRRPRATAGSGPK